MSTEVSVSFSLHRQLYHHRRHHSSAADHHPCYSFLKFPKARNNLSLSSPHFPFPSSSPSSLQNPLEADRSLTNSSSLQNLLQTERFLTKDELVNLDLLSNYSYHQQLESGFLWVRVMRDEELDMTVTLLSESFAESMMMATSGYQKLLEFLVKNYLLERRGMMPHNATLLGIYRENGEEDFELAGTVELTFDRKGANVNPPTPKPPKDSPYICNMAVRKPFRRFLRDLVWKSDLRLGWKKTNSYSSLKKCGFLLLIPGLHLIGIEMQAKAERRGIGWHLLKASEELITKMGSLREVYLHCRMIDEGPFTMYTKAGYSIVETDSILTWLTLQRRRHLMRKELPVSDFASEIEFPIANSTDV
ncbi:acyl-CoA N-acyltransferases-like protein [Striga asiatica]|uniref:Acyl-CoA N-acyltransferases-like protein n=1 Tax=Striga asiatica TaxID=4170 RepID=A0A5A7PI69_STRAF|nr:acyl-CoA N-acyltransferases-like protein [Striga asiatica]